MRVFTRQNGRPAGATDGVSDQAIFKQHTFVRQTVNVGGLVDGGTVRADGGGGVIVRENKQDVRGWSWLGAAGS